MVRPKMTIFISRLRSSGCRHVDEQESRLVSAEFDGADRGGRNLQATHEIDRRTEVVEQRRLYRVGVSDEDVVTIVLRLPEPLDMPDDARLHLQHRLAAGRTAVAAKRVPAPPVEPSGKFVQREPG